MRETFRYEKPASSRPPPAVATYPALAALALALLAGGAACTLAATAVGARRRVLAAMRRE